MFGRVCSEKQPATNKQAMFVETSVRPLYYGQLLVRIKVLARLLVVRETP
jgi:hypothetical protein